MSDRQEHDDLAERAFRQHSGQIYRYLLRKTGSAVDAEELTQRVFVDAAAALSNRDPPDSLLAWLYAVAERRFLDELRRRARAQGAMERLSHERRPQPSLDYGASTARALREAIEALGEESRTVVVMKLLEGRPFAEIAQRTGLTEAACKMRLSRSLRELRRELEQHGIEP